MLTDTDKLKLITTIVATFTSNAEDDDGDKHLSDPDLAIQAIETVLDDGDHGMLIKEGWIESAIAPRTEHGR